MQIPSYQIQNVLNVYSKQLSQGSVTAKNNQAENDIQSPEKGKISAEGKKAAIIEKVASGIVEKITDVNHQEAMKKNIKVQLESEGAKNDFVKKKGEKFTFNFIDENNQKITRTLSVENPNFVINRMTQLAKEAAGETGEVSI